MQNIRAGKYIYHNFRTIPVFEFSIHVQIVHLKADENRYHCFFYKCPCFFFTANHTLASVDAISNFHNSDVTLHLAHRKMELLDNSKAHLACDAVRIQIQPIL